MEGLNEVLQTGPWMFGGRAFIIQQWNASISFNKNNIKTVPVWAKLHNLPLPLWTEEGLSLVTSVLGRPIACDKATYDGTRLAFARVCVEIAADRAPINFFDLDTSLDESSIRVKVEYEWKPRRCSKCCVFGHNCLQLSKENHAKKEPVKLNEEEEGRIGNSWTHEGGRDGDRSQHPARPDNTLATPSHDIDSLENTDPIKLATNQLDTDVTKDHVMVTSHSQHDQICMGMHDFSASQGKNYGTTSAESVLPLACNHPAQASPALIPYFCFDSEEQTTCDEQLDICTTNMEDWLPDLSPGFLLSENSNKGGGKGRKKKGRKGKGH